MALSTISGTTGITDATITSAKLADFAAAVDLNGVELILDADQDTSITADTDDRIDFKIAGVEHFSFSNSSGDTIIKPMVDAKDIKFQQFDGRTLLDINDGGFVGIANGATGAGAIRIFEDTDNGSNYVGLTAGSIGTSLTFTLPTADGSSGQFLKTDGSGALSFDTVSSAADDLTIGDAAVTLSTSSGNITIDATANDTDIIFKGTDNTADITMLTLDGSDAGHATFNNAITSGAVITSGAGLVIADAGNIGSASDTDAIAIASSGVVTFTQKPVINSGVAIDNITIDGTEIDLSSGDLTVDVAGDIILDADGADIIFKDGGTSILTITNNSTDVDFTVATQDKDINFKGDDGGSGITALSLDMSDAGTAVFNHDIRIADGGQIGSASDADAITIGSDGDVTFTQDLELQHDGATLSFGANDEIALTHVHDTGLLLTDSGGTPTLQLHDANESIASDGSKVIITSGGTAFSLPTADGSNTQVIQTNGSGVLSFADAGGGKIGQVVSTHTNATSFSTSASTMTEVTGMSVAITPSATSSKILVIASVTATSNESTRCFLGLKRDSTVIANGNPDSSQIAGVNTGHEQEGNNALFNYHVSFLDSPSSSSEVTYKVTGCAEGSNVFRLNRSPGDSNSNTVSRGASSITVMEILA
jgi:hypothetical protein